MELGSIRILLFSMVCAEGSVKYTRVKSKALQTTYKTIAVNSATECCTQCLMTDDCFSVTYRNITQQCGLSRSRLSSLETDSVSEVDSAVFGIIGNSIKIL